MREEIAEPVNRLRCWLSGLGVLSRYLFDEVRFTPHPWLDRRSMPRQLELRGGRQPDVYKSSVRGLLAAGLSSLPTDRRCWALVAPEENWKGDRGSIPCATS